MPQVIHTDKLWSDGAALRELPVHHKVEHVQVVSTARLNNPTARLVGRNVSSEDSDHDGRRAFLTCTPAWKTFTTPPA